MSNAAQKLVCPLCQGDPGGGGDTLPGGGGGCAQPQPAFTCPEGTMVFGYDYYNFYPGVAPDNCGTATFYTRTHFTVDRRGGYLGGVSVGFACIDGAWRWAAAITDQFFLGPAYTGGCLPVGAVFAWVPGSPPSCEMYRNLKRDS